MEDVEFVPPDFEVPARLVRGGLELVPLGPEHNERDYHAWTSSTTHIRNTPGFAGHYWPHPMSLDENLDDLRRHAEDFRRRVGFTYTVKVGGDIIGCVYIYPSGRRGRATVRSWVRHDCAALDCVLYAMVHEWLENEWPFEGVEYSPREIR